MMYLFFKKDDKRTYQCKRGPAHITHAGLLHASGMDAHSIPGTANNDQYDARALLCVYKELGRVPGSDPRPGRGGWSSG